MKRMRILRYILQTTLLIVVCGCAYPISQEMREKADPDLTYPVVARNPLAYRGATVIWGGVVIGEQNQSRQTVLTILETPLDYRGIPEDAVYNRGRFIARIAVGEDQAPKDYGGRKKIILAGDIVGDETRQVNGTQLRYPVVQVKELHLFPRGINSRLFRPGDYQDRYGYPDYEQSPFRGIQ
jgi:outer membrane lipoprotein